MSGATRLLSPVEPGERDRAIERIRREVQVGKMRVDRVLTTRNRHVMASVGDRGRTLRIHEGFLGAPLEVIRAIGPALSSRRSTSRSQARAALREFFGRLESISPSPDRPRRRHALDPRHLPYLQLLEREFHATNAAFFDSRLPAVPLRLSNRMRRKNGHFCSDPLEIAISERLCAKGSAGEAEQTLRHEMIHLWQWATGASVGHGRDFRAWAVRLGVTPRATRDVVWRR